MRKSAVPPRAISNEVMSIETVRGRWFRLATGGAAAM
jgi:hypothetical protein